MPGQMAAAPANPARRKPAPTQVTEPPCPVPAARGRGRCAAQSWPAPLHPDRPAPSCTPTRPASSSTCCGSCPRTGTCRWSTEPRHQPAARAEPCHRRGIIRQPVRGPRRRPGRPRPARHGRPDRPPAGRAAQAQRAPVQVQDAPSSSEYAAHLEPGWFVRLAESSRTRAGRLHRHRPRRQPAGVRRFARRHPGLNLRDLSPGDAPGCPSWPPTSRTRCKARWET